MNLNNLTPVEGSHKKQRRIGRGQGSGYGGTSTRGHKGAKSRSGYSKKIGFEGGQMPLQRRVPKFGFKSLNRTEYKAVNLDNIQHLVEKKNITEITLKFFEKMDYSVTANLLKSLEEDNCQRRLMFLHTNFLLLRKQELKHKVVFVQKSNYLCQLFLIQ